MIATKPKIDATFNDAPPVVALLKKQGELLEQQREIENALESIAASGGPLTSTDREALELLGRAADGPNGAELAEKLQAVERAIEIVRQDIGAARIEAGQRIAREVEPQYRAFARKVVEAARALLAAIDAEDRAYNDGQRASGLTIPYPRVTPTPTTKHTLGVFVAEYAKI